MNLDLSVTHHRPDTNLIVEKHFRQFPIYLRKETIKAHRYNLHVQPGIEINISLAGTAVFVVGEQIYKTSPGQMLVFPGHIPHQVYVEKAASYRRAVICIDDPTLRQAKEAFPYAPSSSEWFDSVPCYQFQLQMKTFSAVKHTAMHMYNEWQEQKKGWQQMLIAELLGLIVTVGRMVDEQTASTYRLIPKYANSRELAERCCGYIEAHLYDDLTLTSVAAHFHVSPEHLTRTFKRETGLAFYQYVLLQRIQESKRIMAASRDVSLTDIAYTLGFASSSHFSRTFKSVTNMTPREFRLQAHS